LLLDSEVPFLKTETSKSMMLQGRISGRLVTYDVKLIHPRALKHQVRFERYGFAVLKTKSEQGNRPISRGGLRQKKLHKSTAPLAAGVKQ
jgi:hypothetical protein